MEDLIDKKASQDFDLARFKAFLDKIFSLIKKDKNELLSFEIVKQYLMPYNQSYVGVKSIPIKDIIGSEGRYRDFNKNFLPLGSSTRGRWVNIGKAHYKEIELPPIQVYKIGDLYFVKDGNHRVSVAKEKGMKYIDAEIIELKTKIPLKKEMNYNDLILKFEQTKFYESTKLKEMAPQADITLTKAGRYDILIEQIKAHHYLLNTLSLKQLKWEEAVKSWYNTVYMPIIKTIRDLKIMQSFPKNTESDLYIWLINYWNYLQEKSDSTVDTHSAAVDFKKQSGQILSKLKTE
ncbi:MAG: transcriptional regulator [Spirochaetes bacterium]|nr:transcriptional regulator [Spirochaetota bacterium]